MNVIRSGNFIIIDYTDCYNEILEFKHKDFALCYTFTFHNIPCTLITIKRHCETKHYNIPTIICKLLDDLVYWHSWDEDMGLKMEPIDWIKIDLGLNLLRCYIDEYAYSEDGWIYEN